jgi:hypothetical protein
MILLPGRLIYLATPTTGSRSVARILVEQCGGVVLAATHHAHKSDMALLDKYQEPVWTFIRDPYGYIFSRYAHIYKNDRAKQAKPIEDFVVEYADKCRNSRSAGLPYGMSRYKDYADRYWRFEDGLEGFFDYHGLSVDMLTDGMVPAMRERWTYDTVSQECRGLIEKLFAPELELYRSVSNAHQ